MINTTNQMLYRLDVLNQQQSRISYQMSTGKVLQNGSDDSVTFNRLISVDDKIRKFEGLEDQINKTTVQNSVADSSISEIKLFMEDIKTELIKANTDTTTEEGRRSIAVNIAGMKENLLDLANTRVDGAFIFAGSDSTVKPFIEDEATGKIEYVGNSKLKNIAVDEGSYRERGVNGFDMMMFATDTAYSNETLTFSSRDRIIDQDGFEWKMQDAAGVYFGEDGFDETSVEKIVRFDLNDQPSTQELSVTANGTTPESWTTDSNVSEGFPAGTNGIKLEAKTLIFDIIDNAVNTLNGLDFDGNAADEGTLDTNIGLVMDWFDSAFDAVNIAHSDLGARNKVFDISLESVQARLTQYNILSLEIGAADLSKVAVESKALELTFTALYTTINKTNDLSLVNFIR